MTTLDRETLPKIANLYGKPPSVDCMTCHRRTPRPAMALP